MLQKLLWLSLVVFAVNAGLSPRWFDDWPMWAIIPPAIQALIAVAVIVGRSLVRPVYGMRTEDVAYLDDNYPQLFQRLRVLGLYESRIGGPPQWKAEAVRVGDDQLLEIATRARAYTANMILAVAPPFVCFIVAAVSYSLFWS